MASDLDLHCLPMSHKKDARLIWVNSLPTGKFFMLFCCLLIFSQNNFSKNYFFFRKIISGIPYVLNSLEPDHAGLFDMPD